MVNSKINKKINYLEVNSVHLNDINYESNIYIGTLYNKNIKFTIGNPIYDFIDSNIIFFNLYLINNNEIVMKIGLYELTKDNFELLNNDGEIDINNIDPLIFSFVKSYISDKYDEEVILNDTEKKTITPTIDNDKQNIEEPIEKVDIEKVDTEKVDTEKVDTEKVDTGKKFELNIQTKEESDAEILSYKENNIDKWINKYLQSHKYDIKDNEGDGDCFFAVIRDSLKQSNLDKYKNISVNSIRQKLSNEVDDSVFEMYKEFSTFFIGGAKKSSKEVNTLKHNHKLYTKMISSAENNEEKSQHLINAKKNIEKINDTVELNNEFNTLNEEFKFMKDIETIEQLREIIKTNKYWADAWSISTLERIYNVKFIIFSKEHYDNGEIDNVIRCNDLDKKILDKGVFTPEFYICVNYEIDVHYKLIVYDRNINKTCFTFEEIPYRVKEIFIEKCVENAGEKSNYLIIPDIKQFINEKNNEEQLYDDNINLNNGNKQFDEFLNKSKTLDFDDNVVIQIYNKSMHKKVGEGTGESITKEYKTLSNILKLNKIKDWRKKLDNNWILENLFIDGYNFSSVQHYIYAIRFNNSKEIFNKFTKDNNNHKAGIDIDEAKKLYDSILKDKKSYDYNFISDSEYDDLVRKNIEKVLYSKFNQNKELLEILLLTKNYKINLYKQKQGAFLAKDIISIKKLFN